MFKINEYGEEFETKEEAEAFLSDKFEWRYGKGEEIAEAYNKGEWIEERIEEEE